MKRIICVVIAYLLFLTLLVAVANAQTNSRTFTLTWTHDGVNLEGFMVYRDTVKVGQVTATARTFTETVTGPWNQQYCYTVSAFNHALVDGTGALQESAHAGPACGSIPVPTQPAPSAPSNVKLSVVSNSEIRVSWLRTSADATGQHVKRTVTQGPGTSATVPVDADRENYSDKGLRKNTTYKYEIGAYNDAGENYSTAVSAKTPNK